MRKSEREKIFKNIKIQKIHEIQVEKILNFIEQQKMWMRMENHGKNN